MPLLTRRGKPSITLTFVVPAMVLIMAKFALAGLTVFGQTWPEFSGVDFAASFGSIGGIWWMREKTEKTNGME